MENNNQAYKVFTRICLNNWHYINRKVLSLHNSINFFTGHSGSGKSTVIDAMQIVLYANTDGRSFFNKAAADDSDRSLIEYLRGMVNISENNQAEYKRNQNFSTTIALEMEQTSTGEQECIGVVFDVETATNEISRMFFWHKGTLIGDDYRTQNRAMSIREIKEYLQQNFTKDEQFYTASNERFRKNLYEVYLGGLDMEKFPRLFKRAIPFKMNIRLEEFVKEYICMEQDIQIETMQESVILYGRMCRKIEAAMHEIGELEQIRTQHERFLAKRDEMDDFRYRMERLAVLKLQQQMEQTQQKVENWNKDRLQQQQALEELLMSGEDYEKQYDEIKHQINGTGYDRLEEQLHGLEENIHLLERSSLKWNGISARLLKWEEEEIISNQILWDIEKFQKGIITGEEVERLKIALAGVKKEVEKERQDAASESRSLRKEIKVLEADLAELSMGKKAYPRELEAARNEIQQKLYEVCGKHIPVRILADMLDIRDEKWRNAIEGYLGWNKLSLIVEPKYCKEAMKIYEGMDEKKYWNITLVDTDRILGQEQKAKEGALAGEIKAGETYVQAFVNYLLGNVMKCSSVEELRNCRTGVTADCLLYQNFQLRRLNPENYTKRAFIGEKSRKQRQKELQAQLEHLEIKLTEYLTLEEQAARILSNEFLTDSVTGYQEMFADIADRQEKEKHKKKIEQKMEDIGVDSVDKLKEQLTFVCTRQKEIKDKTDDLKYRIRKRGEDIKKEEAAYLIRIEELQQKQKELKGSVKQEEQFHTYISVIKNPSYDNLLTKTTEEIAAKEQQCGQEKNRLVDIRTEYLQNHPNRDFSASAEKNEDYQTLLDELKCDEITVYKDKAAEQAKAAVEHFKEDFIYKIRSAIKEAYVRQDELNRIIRNLNFGKDRYQFRITKNKGLDGEYYDMFMDEDLEIDPATLTASMEQQVNLFTMTHESKFGTRMNDLIHIFIPPENASAAELEEAKQNMEKYADYRTYLSFEMEQIVEGEERLVIGLSKMIKKNSGGEGQNPLYIALLASFAQAYHINLSQRLARRPTIRLVVLDEAFSKMDAEKVASCIELIRSLGFQAIISATNDKIQNYIENVDKTFVYANPNKKSISIQEFEKRDFTRLVMEEEPEIL